MVEDTKFKKGCIPWNKGLKNPYIHKTNCMCASCRSKRGDSPLKGKPRPSKVKRKISDAHLGEKNPMWKGDDVGYGQLHRWIRMHKPKTTLCEVCKINKPIDVANISGEYKRDINDYIWVCRTCHMEMDGRLDRLHENNRKWD